jgi:hypothetical protein
VEYYEKHPLYRKMKLKYAVDRELVESQVIYGSLSIECLFLLSNCCWFLLFWLVSHIARSSKRRWRTSTKPRSCTSSPTPWSRARTKRAARCVTRWCHANYPDHVQGGASIQCKQCRRAVVPQGRHHHQRRQEGHGGGLVAGRLRRRCAGLAALQLCGRGNVTPLDVDIADLFYVSIDIPQMVFASLTLVPPRRAGQGGQGGGQSSRLHAEGRIRCALS